MILLASNCRLTRIEAARKIEQFWCSYRDKQMFKLLKYAICAAVGFGLREMIFEGLISFANVCSS